MVKHFDGGNLAVLYGDLDLDGAVVALAVADELVLGQFSLFPLAFSSKMSFLTVFEKLVERISLYDPVIIFSF